MDPQILASLLQRGRLEGTMAPQGPRVLPTHAMPMRGQPMVRPTPLPHPGYRPIIRR